MGTEKQKKRVARAKLGVQFLGKAAKPIDTGGQTQRGRKKQKKRGCRDGTRKLPVPKS